MRIKLASAAAAALMLAGANFATANEAPRTDDNPDKNIVQIAAEAGTFNTLLQAATEAGLAETLMNGGPFTVFAPTDEAFAKIPQADLEALIADKEALKQVLLFHVVEGAVMADKVVGLDSVQTLSGDTAEVKVMDGKVWIDGAMVTATDIEATNGVIHIIDTVMLP